MVSDYNFFLRQALEFLLPPVFTEIQLITKISCQLCKTPRFAAGGSEAVLGSGFQVNGKGVFIAALPSVTVWAVPEKQFVPFLMNMAVQGMG